MHSGSRAICLLMALLAAVTELVSAAFSPEAQDAAKPAALTGAAVNEAAPSVAASSQAAPVAAESSAPAKTSPAVASSTNFSTSPLEMRVVAYAPHLRVIANSEADGRRMASLADAHERQLLFVKITLG